MRQTNSNGNREIFFSIIIVTLNAEKLISKTLSSILRQSFSDYELIVIDGGSTDHTLFEINALVSKEATVVSEKDNGIYDAMNKGLSRCVGKYVYFINAGDSLVKSSVLEDAHKLICEHGMPDILYGDIVPYSDAVSVRDEDVKHPMELSKEYLLEKTICHQAIFSKKDLFDHFGVFDTRFKICADYAWLLDKVIKEKVSTQFVDIQVCNYSFDGVSSTQNYPMERFRALSRVFPLRFLIINKYLPWYGKKIRKGIKRTIKKLVKIGC